MTKKYRCQEPGVDEPSCAQANEELEVLRTNCILVGRDLLAPLVLRTGLLECEELCQQDLLAASKQTPFAAFAELSAFAQVLPEPIKMDANGRSTISLARPPCNMLQCRSSEQQDKRLTTTHFCCHSSSSETVELYIPRVNVVLDCTVSMIRFVLCLVFLDQSQGLSNLAHVREQNASLTVLQADVNALADSSSRLTLAASQQQKPTKTSTMYRSLSDDFNVVLRSFSVVAVAELFDKTWFVALICAMNYGKSRAFIGAYVALVVHVLLAAALGVAIAQLFSVTVLCFTTATVFLLLAMAYLTEFLRAGSDDDVIQERTGEAKEALQDQGGKTEQAWKDRARSTQVAMVTLHSSAPWVPVCIGSMIAFLVLTLSAVLAASLLEGSKLSERLVLGLSACSFLLFSALAVRDGVLASRQ
eukprot:s2742_g2.t1